MLEVFACIHGGYVPLSFKILAYLNGDHASFFLGNDERGSFTPTLSSLLLVDGSDVVWWGHLM